MTGEEETIEVAEVLGGWYAVTLGPDEHRRWNSTERVPCSRDDRKRWTAARRRLNRNHALLDAVRGPVFSPVKRPWWRRGALARLRWLPGYRAEQAERARRMRRFEESRALADRIHERYRPVDEEIRARVRAIREERERAERVLRERQGPRRPTPHRQPWGGGGDVGIWPIVGAAGCGADGGGGCGGGGD